ncbi:latent-transforming growth factor beta-binding protein 4 [Rana temporaria]|uniref:latent-transforming growth factor beta-binding protein 4 n=1 Tax=Rana temporaria TaxID=8407 RepID=UPI001AACFC5E|nr:latent-transforming growth factor beta-binding protein 4 [Rana temporaria]
MVLVTKTILLWLIGFLGLQGQAQHLNLIHESQGNQTLVLEINATIRKLMNASHEETAFQNTNETRRLNRYGEKVKLIIKQENLVKKLNFKGSKNSSTNRCGDKCCPGWTVALKTGTCTRAVCTPKCKNRGVCKKPQKCVCKIGFEGSYCERRNSALSTRSSTVEKVNTFTPTSLKIMTESQDVKDSSGDPSSAEPPRFQSQFQFFTTILPTTTTELALPTVASDLKSSDSQIFKDSPRNGTFLSWQPLTVHELKSILQRKGFAAKDKMTTLLTKHLETQKTQTAKENEKGRPRTPNAIRTPKGEFNIHRQIQNSASGQVEKVRVMFTPMICRVHCVGDRCRNQCEKGNMTTVYSDEVAKNNGENGFRAFLCPMLCKNGGVCIKKDQCLCPPNFTGRFCQIPLSPGNGIAAYTIRNSSEGQNSQMKSVHTLPLSNHQPEKDGLISVVNVHVKHPPEASVNIHQVEKVDGPEGQANGGSRVASPNQRIRIPIHRVQAQSSPRINGYSETSGYVYCFRRLDNGQCASPFPGLMTQEICCRGSGVAWGIHDCTPCPGYQDGAVVGIFSESSCPKGYSRSNGTCIDIDECKDPSFCQNGKCINTRGSFSCMCKEGYLLDASRSSCISHHVISEVKGPCFRILREGGCSLPILRNITKQICCCSRVGKAWGKACESCPSFGTDAFKEICPAGPGYHYSASDLKINHRFVGHDQAIVPVQRQAGSRTSVTTATPPQRPVTSRLIVEDRRPDREQTGVQVPDQRITDRIQIYRPDRTQIQINRPSVTIERLSPTSPPEGVDTEVEAPSQESKLCELNPQICGPGRCEPRPASYTCVCNNGYWLSTQGTHCIDMDECRQRPSPCANGRCENTIGSYRCACSAGFSTNPQGTECTDIDECNSGQQLCTNGRCENTPGSYRCVCPSGFSLNAQSKTCVDIDECRLTPRRLCLNGRCENTPGSYRCVCLPGYTANAQGTDCQDIDECRQTPRPCGSGRCLNTPGSFRCSCPVGYRLNPQSNDCIDINECENPGACAGQECVNTPGSFQCRQCRLGYRLQNRRCVDINECQTESTCGPSGKCINTDGSFKCECVPGFRLNSDGTRCTDINECLEGEYCFPRGECQNTEGSYRCVCAEGFVTSPDGSSCVDMDECLQGTFCQGGRCTNTVGSFQCACPTGLRATADKVNCADIDECQERGSSICGSQTCENTLGSYKCIAVCDAGYRLTSSGDCADINECANSTVCGENAICENLIGSYRCTCNWGHEMSSEGQNCVDIDECLEYGDSICGSLRCQNTPGSYKCVSDCEPGYQLSLSGDCTDVNECETLQGVCGTALCENVEGSFLCICPNSDEEFDPMFGKCIRTASAARPAFPSHSGASRVDFVPTSGLKECYFNLEDPNVCENVLSRNVSQAECCCTVGKGWGQGCQIQRCPSMESAEYRRLCPEGVGFFASGQEYRDVDECKLFSPEICKGGVCLNKSPLFACYCPNGYYYDGHRMECVDNDECQEEDVCEGGICVNTVGSYFCTCTPPLVLDSSQRRCVTNTSQAIDNNIALCWQAVGADLVCKRPLLDRQTTYTDCCCLYGEAWGMSCALCPARDSDDFEALCNVLRSPGYGSPGSPPVDPYEYGSEYGAGYGVPYGADSFPNPPPRVVRPGYEAYPAPPGVGFGQRPPPYGPRDPVYSLPPYESPDFESDISYPDSGIDELRPPFRRPESPYDPRLQPSPPRSRPRSPTTSRVGLEDGRRPQPWRPGGRDLDSWRAGLREAYDDRYEQFEGLQAEECGILNGCENGRCIRVPEGYTCDCYDGYRLDMTRMACIDINECDEAEDLSLLCLNGQCRNTDGAYECICPRGFVLSPQNYCVPSQQ